MVISYNIINFATESKELIMKAKEVMINDWVKLKNQKGEWIDNSQVGSGIMACALDETEFLVLEPIPLTEEILKLNGFIFKEDENEWWHYNPFPFSDFQIGYYNDDCNDMRFIAGCIVTNIKLKYVHQLQHVLRLCGLDEFADKFKIK